jgi:uncharacterized membrane protein
MQRVRYAVLATALITLALGYKLKSPCLTLPWGPPALNEYNTRCYNDLQVLYGLRHLDKHSVPYVEERPFEYPPVMAVQLWLTSHLAGNHVRYFIINAYLLAIVALLTVYALLLATERNGRPSPRVFWFAAAPPLALYAFHNWDLLAVAPVAAAMLAWRYRAETATGAFLGVGAAAKLFPGFALPPLVLHALRSEKDSGAVKRLVFGAVAWWLAFSLPFFALDWLRNGNVDGWLEMFRFHARRYADFGSIWYWMGPVTDEYRRLIDRVSFGLFLGGTIAVLACQYRRRLDPWAAAGAIVAIFLLVNKVHSPQYALWLLPFFVATRVPAPLILAYFAADGAVFDTSSRWASQTPSMGPGRWQNLYCAAVFVRAGLLLAIAGTLCSPAAKPALLEQEDRRPRSGKLWRFLRPRRA